MRPAARSRSHFTQRFTVATGLLALTLFIGPANLLLRKRNHVSSYLRRDEGIWTALFSVVHVIYGSLLHSSGQLSGILNYFFAPDGSPRLNSFGLGNWTGLAAHVALLATVSTQSLSKIMEGSAAATLCWVEVEFRPKPLVLAMG
jgi:hypothetical protein